MSDPFDDELEIHDDELFGALFDEDEEIPRPRRTGMRIIAAALLIGLVGLLVLQPGGLIFRSSGDHDDGVTPAKDSASTVATLLERTGASLTAADWRIQLGASVLIGVGSPRCAGAVTDIGGRRFVTSARHCLEDLLDDGVVSPEAGQAQEVTGRLHATLRVFDPDTHRPIATLERIVVGTGDTDLLVATTRSEAKGYRSKRARSVDRLPAVGDEVATYASAGAVGFDPGRLNGIYLGSRVIDGGQGHEYAVDLIGYRQPSSSVRVGRGHSGHSPTGAGGTAFGPLLFSVNAETPQSDRVDELRAMSDATGLDLAAEELVSIDESLHLQPSDYARFADLLR
jgi:hypothetical protein